MNLSTNSNSQSDKKQSLDHPAVGTFATELSELPVSSPIGQQRELMTLKQILIEVDPLMIAIGLAFAACAPGPAGEAGAVAAITFDVSRRRWYLVALSAASMIPLIGYIPALFKVGWLLSILSRRLKAIEDMLPEGNRSAEDVEMLRDSFGKYYRRLPKMNITRSIRSRLERIMSLDDPVQTALAQVSDCSTVTRRESADDPK